MAIEFDSPEKSYELFKKGKREGTWDPDDIDLAQDKADWDTFDEDEQEMFLGISSGFYEGEEDVTRTLSPYMYALEGLDEDGPFDAVQEEMYLSQQVYEEAKHTDFFSRYFELVAGTQDLESYQDDDGGGYSIKDLYDKGEDLIDAKRAGDQRELLYALGDAYLEYMGIVEAQQARAGYMVFDQIIDLKAEEMGRDVVLPGFQEGIGLVRQDETRHIENGRWVLKQLAEAEPDIVSDVYEPRMQAYIDHQLLSDDQPEFDRAYPGFDGKQIFIKSQQFLQDTIDYIGRERFEELTDVESTVRETMAAAD
jgi:ribonucleoside-diphosphate reductase beta chain